MQVKKTISSKLPADTTFSVIYQDVCFFLFPQISQVLNLQTLASNSSYQLPMEHMISLIRDLRFEMYFLTYLS